MEDLGAGEILLNCIDNDGVGQGFDLDLVGAVAGERHSLLADVTVTGQGVGERGAGPAQRTAWALGLAGWLLHACGARLPPSR